MFNQNLELLKEYNELVLENNDSVVNIFDQLTKDLQSNDNLTQDDIDAWKKNNTEKYAKLEKIRENTLKQNGWTTVAYHATNKKFTTFQILETSNGFGAKLGLGVYTTQDIKRAKSYKTKLERGFIMKLFLSLKNSLTIENDDFSTMSNSDKNDIIHILKSKSDGSMLDPFPDAISLIAGKLHKDAQDEYLPTIINKAIRQIGHYQSIISKKNNGNDFLTFNQNQIKSADPLSIENGKLITPNQWADENNSDIRY